MNSNIYVRNIDKGQLHTLSPTHERKQQAELDEMENRD